MNVEAMHLAAEFVRAINTHDPDALASLMTPDHKFIDSLGNIVAGRDKMRSGWAGYFAMVPDYSVTVEETLVNRDVVVFLGRSQGAYQGKDGVVPENRWHTPIAIRARVDDGLVAEWRVYADNEPLRALIRKA